MKEAKMANSFASTEDAMRLAFKRLNVFMIWMWRLGLRRWINFWPGVTGRIMVLIHTGRKTGLRRQTPVNYAKLEGRLYCIAGFGHISDWYRNILANPKVEVWLPDGWWVGHAEDISDHTQRDHLIRQVMFASGLAAPLFGVDPRKLDNQEFAAVTQEYRLIRIQLIEPLSGSGGPGDLAWVWIPVSLVVGLIVLLIRGKREAKS
jgi:deazaflavin-dependent oxidoreductase (nitroreductase family)